MVPKLSVLLLLAVAVVVVLGQKRRPVTAKATEEWNYKDGCELCLFTGVKVQGSESIMMM